MEQLLLGNNEASSTKQLDDKKENSKNAVIYVSGKNLSNINIKLESCHKYCINYGYNVLEVYKDFGDYYKFDRKEALRMVRETKGDMIIDISELFNDFNFFLWGYHFDNPKDRLMCSNGVDITSFAARKYMEIHISMYLENLGKLEESDMESDDDDENNTESDKNVK